MNFHKTIGFLATLLLIVGIGVPDSFAQETKTVDISFSDDFRLKRIREGRTVSVVATLSEEPAEGETVTVNLDLEVPEGDSIRYDVGTDKYVAAGQADGTTSYFSYTLTGTDINAGVPPGISSQQPAVTISGDDEETNSITLTSVANGIYRHPRIDSVAVSIVATNGIVSSVGGANDWTEVDDNKELKFGLQEAEEALGTITVNSFVPPSLSQGFATEQSVTVKVTVDIVAAVNVATTVTVGLSYEFLGADGNAMSDVSKDTDETIDVTVPIDGLTNKGSTTSITFTAVQTRAQDGQDAVTNIKVTASLAGYTPDDKTLAVIDREADTLQGFQVFVVETDNKWKKTTKEHIKVQVIRHKAIAFPWESFASIRIALHDSTGDDADDNGLEDDEKVQLDPRYGMPENLPPAISHITVKNLVVDGKLSFQAVSVPSGGQDKSKATYKDVDKDTEMIEFLMGVPNNWADADVAATVDDIDSFHYPGAIVDNAYVPDRSQEIDFHRYEVFAVVLFSTDDAAGVDSDDRYLTSDDTGKSIYPRSPNLFSEKVGNGVHVRIDALKPDGDVIKDLVLTINKEAPNVAKIGDKIRIAAKIGGGGEIFQEHKVQLKIVAQGQGAGFGVAYKGGAEDLVKTFTATQVFGASSDSLRFEYEVAPGKFQVKAKDPAGNAADFATLQSHPVYGDGSPIGKNELFDGVGLEGKAQVIVLDEAGNTAVEDSAPFDLDSGKPKITLVYPKPTAPDSNRITGTYEAEAGDDVEDVSEFLRPLRFAVNEETIRRAVFVVGGPDTLDLEDSDGDSHANRDSIRYSTARRYVDDTEQADRRGEGLHVEKKVKDGEDEYVGTGQGGKEIELAILVEDVVGNQAVVKIPGVYHDEMPPVLENWFPKNSLLEESDNKINVATLNPVLSLPEDVDSIGVTFSASAGDIIQDQDGITAKGETQVAIDDFDSFEDGEDYTMTVFVRDLAGNVYITPADSSANMTFDAGFDNPKANSFTITTETDSVIAGQANKLTVQAVDVSDEDETISRKALTYKNKDVDDNPAFDVLVSARDIKDRSCCRESVV